MASTSTSCVQKSFKYDVFLSFRGDDTRNNFVSHLYKALEKNGIQTYKDDKKIQKGETIDTQLMKSIEDSRFFIIVFSKDYAGSSWCLDELVKIMECQETSEQTAYPIFYNVEPTDIRKQSGAVEKAFKKHENKEPAGKWRKALNEASNLAGWESNGDESKLIQKIVDEIFEKKCSSISSVDGNLVGMKTRIEDVLSSLELDVGDVRMIGIWGIGGGGKTTLAKAVFDRISYQFEGKAFVENVREVSKSSLGLNKLQEHILCSVLSRKSIPVRSVHEGTNMMKTLLRGRKVLIVLDDVDDEEQLEALAGEPKEWFKFGSRLLITTRDKQVLSAPGVKFIDVNLLSRAEAICLLSKNAFKRDIPIEGFEELSGEVVNYADGLPLTIKVLGSLLCGQNELEWMDTLERLRTIPLRKILEKLELSYEALDDDYKEIFLDVACLLKGWNKDDAIRALESCGFYARNGLRVLEQRSLITISEDEKLGMHDRIEEMGKNIVRRLHPNNPNKHTRLWIQEEIEEILANDSVKKKKWWWKLAGKKMLVEEVKATQAATQCLKVQASRLNLEMLMKGLTNMKELKFLHLNSQLNLPTFNQASNWNLPNSLRFLRWDTCHFSSLPKTFQPNNLVGLQMHISLMQQFWKDGEDKPFPNLRFLKITHSRLKTLDLSVAPNLETLILKNCEDLREVHFQVTPNLKKLHIGNCSCLENLHIAESPELIYVHLFSLRKLSTLYLGITPNLEKLSITLCTRMVELRIPAECPKLTSLCFNRCNDTIEELQKFRTQHMITPNLEDLDLKGCPGMVELRIPAECPILTSLDLKDLQKLRTLHLGITPNLEVLSLEGCTDMVELRIPAECPKLTFLHLEDLQKLRSLDLGITQNLEVLLLKACTDMVELLIPAECPKLTSLCLEGCTDMVELRIPVECPKLTFLYLKDLKNLRTLHLGITPNLVKLTLRGCTDMVELRIPAECPKLTSLYLEDLQKLRSLDLGITPNLEVLFLRACTDMVELRIPAECPKLTFLYLDDLQKLRSLDLGITPNLEVLLLRACTDVVELRIPTECPKLFCLVFSNCIQLAALPEEIGRLDCLKKLDITGTGISRLPESIFRLIGLCIYGSRELLESYGSPKIKIINDQAYYYIDIMP